MGSKDSDSSDIDIYDEPSILTLREVSLDSGKHVISKHSRNLSVPIDAQKADGVSYLDFLLALQGSNHSSMHSRSPPKVKDDLHSILTSALENKDCQRISLPIFGLSPCAAYCYSCRTDVHTVVVFRDHKLLSKQILMILMSAFGCCNMPAWLRRLRIHKCPFCSMILGNSCT